MSYPSSPTCEPVASEKPPTPLSIRVVFCKTGRRGLTFQVVPGIEQNRKSVVGSFPEPPRPAACTQSLAISLHRSSRPAVGPGTALLTAPGRGPLCWSVDHTRRSKAPCPCLSGSRRGLGKNRGWTCPASPSLGLCVQGQPRGGDAQPRQDHGSRARHRGARLTGPSTAAGRHGSVRTHFTDCFRASVARDFRGGGWSEQRGFLRRCRSS